MANHELSGPLVWSMLYKILKKTGPHKFSYRFLICPENIGSAAFLHYSKKKIKNIVAGYIIHLAGNGKEITYKKSRIGNSLADQAAENVIKNSNFPFQIIEFFPDGSDERQFCSPGFNMPIGLLMRKMYGRQDGTLFDFKEYHTSLDRFDTVVLRCENKKVLTFTFNILLIQIDSSKFSIFSEHKLRGLDTFLCFFDFWVK